MEAWLCLAGGNALGAFHVGAWAVIEQSGLRVTRMSGASIGAVVASLIAGNPPSRRTEALRGFLARVRQDRPVAGRRASVTGMLMRGHPPLFVPSWPGLWEILPGMPADKAQFRRGPMRRLLERFIDFDLLNNSDIEVTITALDAEAGEIVDFRNRDTVLTVDHLMASTALPILFRPIHIDGRAFLDPGLCENLPLRPLLDRPGDAAIIALDLFARQGKMLETMDGIGTRAQELFFAGQSARIIRHADLAGRNFRHIVLTDPEDVFVGKAFDFGRSSLERRVRLGAALTHQSLTELTTLIPVTPEPTLEGASDDPAPSSRPA
jgi:NTE family protein